VGYRSFRDESICCHRLEKLVHWMGAVRLRTAVRLRQNDSLLLLFLAEVVILVT
jgi:hypothetical protein